MKNILKHVLTLLLVAALLLPLFNFQPSPASAGTSNFAGGSGEIRDPYLVETAEHLNNVRSFSDAYFKQIADIDLDVLPDNKGEGWVPIPEFSGYYNGDGKIISNLKIDRDEHVRSGLFDTILGAGEIANVVLNGVSIVNPTSSVTGSLVAENEGTITDSRASGLVRGHSYVGGLVGINWGDIENCSVEVTVQGRKWVGGLVGVNSHGMIKSSHATGNVIKTRDSEFYGGLVGANNGGDIIDSSAEGGILGYKNVGGLVGRNLGTISHSRAEGKVFGNENVGGLVGFNEVDDTDTGIVENSYASGNVGFPGEGEGDEKNFGGLVGINWGAITGSRANGDVEGKISIGGLIGLNQSSGYADNAFIKESYASGAVEGENSVGGLVGFNGGAGTVIENSYATGSAQGSFFVGGLVGYNAAVIKTSYSIGAVEGIGVSPILGGLIGFNDALGTVNNSYYDFETSGQDDEDKGIPKTTEEMQSGTPSPDIYTGWSEDIWTFTPDNMYPWLDVFGPGPTFSDVPTTHPFFTEIEALAATGITTGWPDGTFRPTLPVTRQAAAAFLDRALDLDQEYDVPVVPTFIDVPTDHPYYDEIERLVAAGITTGWPDGSFRPNADVTRQAVAAFLYRGLELEDVMVKVPTFSDVPLDHPFFDEIEALAATGITTGWPDSTFRPTLAVTRQAMAAFLVRGLELEDAGE